MSVSRRINQNNLKKIFANLKFWLETALKKIGTDSTLQKIGKKVLVSAKHFSLVTRKNFLWAIPGIFSFIFMFYAHFSEVNKNC